jgi:hypothetical protein
LGLSYAPDIVGRASPSGFVCFSSQKPCKADAVSLSPAVVRTLAEMMSGPYTGLGVGSVTLCAEISTPSPAEGTEE